ncbi:TPA: hypothetical protein L4746_005647, partial [Pseudomonas aeruginosa]|nr:hypothetical protein [Pseudomonas aeruginosa]HBO6275260.1 hypothetical protein [Pseudomonas aeruginosa]HBO6293685.1 hypothetical protein [Pseudomonas aeruginosa]
VAFAGEQALVIVGEGGIAAGAVGRGFAFDGDDAFDALDHLEAVGGLLAVFVGDGGGAVIVVGEGDLFGAVGVFAGDGAALVVVGPGGEAGSIFIRYPG